MYLIAPTLLIVILSNVAAAEKRESDACFGEKLAGTCYIIHPVSKPFVRFHSWHVRMLTLPVFEQ